MASSEEDDILSLDLDELQRRAQEISRRADLEMRKLDREAQAPAGQEDTKQGHQIHRPSVASQPRPGISRRRTDGETETPLRSRPLPDLRSLEISGSLARADRHITDPNFCPSPLRPKRRGTPFASPEQKHPSNWTAMEQTFEQISVPRKADEQAGKALSSPRERIRNGGRSLTSPASVPALRREDAFKTLGVTGSNVFMDQLVRVSSAKSEIRASKGQESQDLPSRTSRVVRDRQTTVFRSAEAFDVFTTPQSDPLPHEPLRIGRSTKDVETDARQSDTDDLNFGYENEAQLLAVPLRTESPFVGQKLSFDHMFGPVLNQSPTEELVQHPIRGCIKTGRKESEQEVEAYPSQAKKSSKSRRSKDVSTIQDLGAHGALTAPMNDARHRQDQSPDPIAPQAPKTPIDSVQRDFFSAPQTPPNNRFPEEPEIHDAARVQRTPRSTDRSRVLSTIAEDHEDSPDSQEHTRGTNCPSNRMPAVMEESPEVLSPAQALDRELEILESEGKFPGGRSQGREISRQRIREANVGKFSGLF